MRRALQTLAATVILGGVITWAATGANRGWTKTSVAVKTLDPVTEIEGITYEKKFLPGVDFLGAAGVVAVALAEASLFFRKPKNNQTTNQ